MIRYRAVGFVLGHFLLVFAATMLVPVAWGLLRGSGGLRALLLSAVLTAASGAGLLLCGRRPDRDLSQREGLLLVCATWVGISAVGALPFHLSPHFASYTDAFFEATSGVTTTGSSILADVEVLPEAIQFWRCFLVWLGGMGIVLLGIAILPLLGHGGMQLYRAEFSGARSERLKPRIAETALALWKLYAGLSIALYTLLRIAGMPAFDALCHTFSVLGSGGFSSRTASAGAFDDVWIEAILIVFMLLAGISFIQHYRLWVLHEPRKFFRDYEVRAFLLLALTATIVIGATLVLHNAYTLEKAARKAAFQVASILTSTGLVNDDFELWYPLAQLLLLALMFTGGCTGSTAGGLKVARVVLLGRVVGREFRRMVERRGVFAVRLGGRTIDEATVQSLLSLVYLALITNFAACLLLAAMGVDVLTAITAVATCMWNNGPGLGTVGPMENFGHLPGAAKWVLSGCMLAGRLEFYTILVLLSPAFWKK